jgi:hypothetical protein
MGKKTKITLAIVLLAVAAVLIYRGLRAERVVAAEVSFVCVATGETFDIDMEDVQAIPARNPKTNEWTLLPCERREDGTLVIARLYANSLRESLKLVNQFVDPKTLEVRKPGGS